MSFLNKVVNIAKKGWEDFTGQTAWKMQADYNTPANQVERYREAGLNPNLIYGNGQSSAGNMTSAPNYQGGFDAIMSMINMVKGVADIKTQSKQTDLDAMKTIAGIEHSKDVLDFERKKMLIDAMFRSDEFNWNVGKDKRDFSYKQEQDAKNYALNWARHELEKDQWNFKKDHYMDFGTYPGTTVDYLNMLLSNFLQKPVTDVMGDAGNTLNNAIEWTFSGYEPPITKTKRFSKFLGHMLKGAGKKIGKAMSNVRY